MRASARRTIWRLAVILGAVAHVATASGCGGENAVPERLADGTRALRAKVAFEDVRVPVIATRVEAAREVLPRLCPRPSGAIDRIGVVGASRTSLSSRGRVLRACDWTARSASCGTAYARLTDGRLRDPRLTLTCLDEGGETLAFLWITPLPETEYLVVTADGYAESYRVDRGLPIRVTTDDVTLETSAAIVHASEHTRDGDLLRVRRIEAQVSG